MRKIVLAIISTLTSAGLMLGVAAAQTSDCNIVNTGPNSNNTCTIKDENDLNIKCNNNVDVVFVNGQSAGSGEVTLTNNTNGGYAYSGNAVNTNSTTGKLDVSCGAKEAAAPAPAPTPAPAAVPVAAAAQPTPAPQAQALPSTGNNSLVASSMVVSAVVLVGAFAARLALSVYRKAALK
jgi:hypothetical protein